jgi:hypothetical protein
MLRAIEAKAAAPIPSPYLPFLHNRTTATLLIALMIALGASGTVLASETAKPGDLLFHVDRAREEVQLALASDARKSELRTMFTDERLTELRAIIGEESVESPDDDNRSGRTINEKGEVRIAAAVQVLLDNLEDVDDGDRKKVLLNELLKELDVIRVAGRENRARDAAGNTQTEDSRIKLKDDRIEIREDGYRIRIDDDGEIRIKQDDDASEGGHKSDGDGSGDKSSGADDVSFRGDGSIDDDNGYDEYEEGIGDYHSDDSSDDFEDNNDDDRDDTQSSSRIEKFEVRVEGGRAEVHLKYGGQEDEYETTYTSDEDLIAEAAGRSGLPIEELIGALDIEVR